MHSNLAISIILAASVVMGGLYVAERSSESSIVPLKQKKDSRDLAPHVVKQANDDRHDQRHAEAPKQTELTELIAPPPGRSSGAIMKCTINGRTTYSDHACEGPHAQVVEISASHGISGDAQQNAKWRNADRAHVDTQRARSSTTNSTSSSCAAVEAQLKRIEKIENERRDAHTRHWAAKERAKLKKKQCMAG